MPVLIRWLPRVEDPDIKEDIVRTLSVPFARPQAARPLVDAFLAAPDDAHLLKWAIGGALSVVADDSIFDDIVAIARDRRYGKAREMVVVALGNMKMASAPSKAALIELLSDEEVVGHAIMALGKLRAVEARTAIEERLSHPKAWVRSEAKKALERIDRVRKRR